MSSSYSRIAKLVEAGTTDITSDVEVATDIGSDGIVDLSFSPCSSNPSWVWLFDNIDDEACPNDPMSDVGVVIETGSEDIVVSSLPSCNSIPSSEESVGKLVDV